MDSLFATAIRWAIIIVSLAAVYKMVVAYLHDSKIKQEIKNLLIVLLILGALPTLSHSAPKVGENLVKPVVAIVENVSNSISSDMRVQ
jgi:hypothetical protein